MELEVNYKRETCSRCGLMPEEPICAYLNEQLLCRKCAEEIYPDVHEELNLRNAVLLNSWTM